MKPIVLTVTLAMARQILKSNGLYITYIETPCGQGNQLQVEWSNHEWNQMTETGYPLSDYTLGQCKAGARENAIRRVFEAYVGTSIAIVN